MRSIAWLALACIPAFSANAEQAYKIIGADGAIIYTDRPVPGAVEIRIPKPSSYAPRELSSARLSPEPEPVVRDVYAAVRIIKPEAEATIHAGEGGVDVDVQLDPPLQEGHTFTYSVDGKETAKGLRTNRVRITDLDRGTHHVEVTVRDEGGVLVGRSDRVTFHLRRPSINDPQRPDQPKGRPGSAATPTPLPAPAGYAPAAPAKFTPPPAAGYAPPAAQKPPYAPSTAAPYAPAYTPSPP
jgi:hypothetical protein